MRKLLALSYVILVAGFACLAHAQLTQTGAGKVGGGGGGGGYVGPGDIVGSAYFWGGFRAYSAAKRGTKAVNVCNSAVANCVDVNSDAVTGKVVITAGTVAGTDCTAAVGNCLVNIIYDQTGNARDIAAHINPPALNASCTTSSQPCAHFMAANNAFFITAALTLAQPFSFSYWAKNTNTGVQQDFYYSSTVTCNTNLVINRFNRNPAGAANQMTVYAGAFQDVTVNDGVWNGLGILYSGATSKVSVNGGAPTTINPGTDTGNSEPWAIGVDCAFTSNKWTGDFTEIGAWNSDISASFSSLSTNQSGFY